MCWPRLSSIYRACILASLVLSFKAAPESNLPNLPNSPAISLAAHNLSLFQNQTLNSTAKFGICQTSYDLWGGRSSTTTGTSSCRFDSKSQNRHSRVCVHDWALRCGRAIRKANSNSKCPSCVLWACAQDPPTVLPDGIRCKYQTIQRFRRGNNISSVPFAIFKGGEYGSGSQMFFNVNHSMVVPMAPSQGVGDSNAVKFTSLWSVAWQLRGTTPLEEWGVAINNEAMRGQLQMHIHAAPLIPGNRAAIEAITSIPTTVRLRTGMGSEVLARALVWDRDVLDPATLKPFDTCPTAESSILITAGPNGEGMVLFALTSNDCPTQVLVHGDGHLLAQWCAQVDSYFRPVYNLTALPSTAPTRSPTPRSHAESTVKSLAAVHRLFVGDLVTVDGVFVNRSEFMNGTSPKRLVVVQDLKGEQNRLIFYSPQYINNPYNIFDTGNQLAIRHAQVVNSGGLNSIVVDKSVTVTLLHRFDATAGLNIVYVITNLLELQNLAKGDLITLQDLSVNSSALAENILNKGTLRSVLFQDSKSHQLLVNFDRLEYVEDRESLFAVGNVLAIRRAKVDRWGNRNYPNVSSGEVSVELVRPKGVLYWGRTQVAEASAVPLRAVPLRISVIAVVTALSGLLIGYICRLAVKQRAIPAASLELPWKRVANYDDSEVFDDEPLLLNEAFAGD